MTIRVGILGLGFMGNCHFHAYDRYKHARVAALCDIDKSKLKADAATAGNIATGSAPKDLSGVKTYTKADDLFADPDVDVIDITLPTYLHAEHAIQAMQAGKDVICEKPMAISSSDAKKMVAAAKKTGRRLFVAQCIRFWPAYAKLREIIQERKYGNVHSAVFTRLSPTPTWTWKNWVLDPRKGGSATLDLHIHDADFILYTFGKPKAVFSRGSGSLRHGFDHVVTSYDYGKGKLISAEGTWDYAPTFKFSMTFRVVMDKATVELGADGQLTVHGNDGSSTVVSVADEDGYTCELRHFIDCLRHGRSSPIVAPQSAMQSIRLVEAEIRSMATGRSVAVRLSSNT